MNSSFFQQLKHAIDTNLPGESAHLPMSPTGRGKTSELIKFAKGYRQSSVAIILFSKDDTINIILTERMAYDGPHSAQISFPGGRYEDFDKNYIQTAIRETNEEIGVQLDEANLLGKLSNVFIPVSKFLVHPYVFYCESEPQFANNYEVKETFSITTLELQDDQFVKTMDVQVGEKLIVNVPCFEFKDKKIWGATAIILNEFKTLINSLYQ